MVPDELLGLDPLLLGRGDVERQHRQHRAVHRHADAHLVERDAVEQRARVVDRVDRDAGHADVAAHPRVVGVVAAVGGQVEGDAQALLPGREVAPVERVGLLGGREAGVLPDRPGLGGVHRRVGPAEVRREAGPGVERVEALEVARRRRPAGCRCPRGCARGVPLVDEVALRPSRDQHRPRPGAARRSSSERSSEHLPGPGQEVDRVDAQARTSRRPSRPASPGHDHPTSRRPRAERRGGLAPLGVGRVRAGQAHHAAGRRRPRPGRRPRRWRRRRRRRPRRRPAGWWRTPARAVWAATGPRVARKTWAVGGVVAQRLEGGAVVAHAASSAVGRATARAGPPTGSGTR